MFILSTFGRLLVGAGLVTSIFSGTASVQSELPGNTPVVVVFDATKEAECLSWVGTKDHETECDPGSVISSYVTTYAEAKKNKMKHYYTETGNKEQDKKVEHELAKALRKEIKGTQYSAMACVQSGLLTKGASYKADINNANSPRVEYKFEYKVWNNCSVTDIWDWSRTTFGSTEWERSCSRTGQAVCRDRNIIINVNWSQQWWIDNTEVNQEYWHISDYCITCRENYGINTFTN